jgi:hypothetical protein
MSPSPLGHGARLASFRPKNSPILSSAARLSSSRTAVSLPTRRTGGVETPTRRSPGAAGPPVEDAVALALDMLDQLQRRAREVADGFRWNRVNEANRGLGELVQSTHTLLRLAMAAASATGSDIEALCVCDGIRVDEETRVAVDQLITHQFAEDWLAVADTIDEDFAPALAQWRLVFEAIGSSTDDDGGRAA